MTVKMGPKCIHAEKVLLLLAWHDWCAPTGAVLSPSLRRLSFDTNKETSRQI